jgi:hypothetical protein
MNLTDAINKCHIRSAVYRASTPEKRYYKNNSIPLFDRIPSEDQSALDWEEYDPRDDDDCSLFIFND